MATSIFHPNFPGAEALQQAVDTAAFVIGLDLHKKTIAICVIDRRKPEQPVFQRKRLQNAELLSSLLRFPGRKVVVCEAAYGWFTLRDALAPLADVTLILLDPRKTASWIATSGIKNDGIDAQILCHTCLHGGIPSLAVHQPNRAARECWKLIQHREQLVRLRTRIKNQLKPIDRDYGANPFTGEFPERSDLIAFIEADLHNALQGIKERIEAMDREIAALSKGDAVVSLLQTIPGIGPITSFALRHKIERIERFADHAHLSSYFGFGLRQWQSGERQTKGKIAKTGNSLIRSLLMQGAQAVCHRSPGTLALYFPTLGQEQRMANPRHGNKIVTALARKNLTFVYHIWKHRTPFDLERYRQRREQQRATSPVPSERAAELVRLLAR